jgi:hypothetical protein
MQNAKANKTCRGRKLTNTLVRKPGAGDRHARFDERDLETEHLGATAPDLDSTAKSVMSISICVIVARLPRLWRD